MGDYSELIGKVYIDIHDMKEYMIHNVVFDSIRNLYFVKRHSTNEPICEDNQLYPIDHVLNCLERSNALGNNSDTDKNSLTESSTQHIDDKIQVFRNFLNCYLSMETHVSEFEVDKKSKYFEDLRLGIIELLEEPRNQMSLSVKEFGVTWKQIFYNLLHFIKYGNDLSFNQTFEKIWNSLASDHSLISRYNDNLKLLSYDVNVSSSSLIDSDVDNNLRLKNENGVNYKTISDSKNEDKMRASNKSLEFECKPSMIVGFEILYRNKHDKHWTKSLVKNYDPVLRYFIFISYLMIDDIYFLFQNI